MSKHENWNELDRAGMERMSTDSLKNLLLEDFHSPERGESDMSDLYSAAQVLAERTPCPQDSIDKAWERFRENYLPFAAVLSEDGGAPSSDDAQGRRHSTLRRWTVRAALAAAVLCVLLLSISTAGAANGRDWLSFLALWTDEEIWLAPGQISPAGEEEIHIPEEPREYSSLQEALEDCGLTRPIVPQWMPEGYVLEELIVDDVVQSELLFHACYTRSENSLVIMVCVYLDCEGSHGNYQKDAGKPIPYEAGGITHLLSTNAGRPIAVWANGPAECAFCGDVTMEELKQMIDSIYE